MIYYLSDSKNINVRISAHATVYGDEGFHRFQGELYCEICKQLKEDFNVTTPYPVSGVWFGCKECKTAIYFDLEEERYTLNGCYQKNDCKTIRKN